MHPTYRGKECVEKERRSWKDEGPSATGTAKADQTHNGIHRINQGHANIKIAGTEDRIAGEKNM